MEDKIVIKATIKSIQDQFKKNIFGIQYYFEKFGNLAYGADEDEIQKLTEFIDACFTEFGIDILDSKSKTKNIKLSKNKLDAFARKLRKQPKISVKNYEILSRSSFLMLNNYFEYLLSDLISYHYNKFQNTLNDKLFNITLKEINEYETIDDIVKSLIIKEVEAMMVEMTFDKILDHFHNNLGIDNEKELVNWDLIRECRERRHLIVHNSSVVNKKYLTRTNNPFSYKVGDIIKVDPEYFKNASLEIYLAGLLLSYNCWGKWDKHDATEAIRKIMLDSFELLKQKEYHLVSRLTTFAEQIDAKNDDQEDLLFRIKFNKMIALKKLDDKGALAKEIKRIKIGTVSPIFKLAYEILTDNHKNIIDLVRKAKSIGEIDHEIYLDWPIYDFIRDNQALNLEIEKELILTKPRTKTRVSKTNVKMLK